MERKDFIRNFLAGGSLLLASPMIFNSCSNGMDEAMDDASNNQNKNTGSGEIDLNSSDFSSLKSVGGFAYKGDIIIIRSGETSYIALSKICTHQGCTVSYNPTSNELPCPCHGSKFDTSGNVLQGPASGNLKKYTVTVVGNTLKIT